MKAARFPWLPNAVSEFTPSRTANAPLERYLNAVELTLLDPLERADDRSEGRPEPAPEQMLVRQLVADPDVVVKRADKAPIFVLLDKSRYVAEAMSPRQLGDRSTYAPLPWDPQELLTATTAAVRSLVRRISRCTGIHQSELACLIEQAPRNAAFYLLPKVHKQRSPDLPSFFPFRSIVSQVRFGFHLVSQVLHELLWPTMGGGCFGESVTSSLDFVAIMQLDRTSGRITAEHKTLMLDVENMFIRLNPAKVCSEVMMHWHERAPPDHPISPSLLGGMVQAVLENCTFVFEGACFRQIVGLAMGSRASVCLAGITTGKFVRQWRLMTRWWPHVSRGWFVTLMTSSSGPTQRQPRHCRHQ